VITNEHVVAMMKAAISETEDIPLFVSKKIFQVFFPLDLSKHTNSPVYPLDLWYREGEWYYLFHFTSIFGTWMKEVMSRNLNYETKLLSYFYFTQIVSKK